METIVGLFFKFMQGDEFMLKITNDFINLTQGQLLIKYWWLWLIIIVFTCFYMFRKKLIP